MSEGFYSAETTEQEIEEKFETVNVKTIEKPLRLILNQAKDNLENGAYSLLVGDDTSARLITLTLKKVVDYIDDRKGLPHIPTIFIQAGRYINPEQIEMQIKNIKDRWGTVCEGKKILLITDYVRSGGTMKRLSEMFNASGLNFDVATVDMDQSEESYRKQGVFSSDTVVFSGNPSSEHKQPEIWGNPAMVGLGKDKDSEISRGRANNGTEMKIKGLTHKTNQLSRELQGEARRDVNQVAKRLIHSLYHD